MFGKGCSVELDNAFFIQDGIWLESVTISSEHETDYEELVGDISEVVPIHTELLSSNSTGKFVQRAMAFVNEPYPFILAAILQDRAVPNRIILKEGKVHTTVTVEDWDQFKQVSDGIDNKFGQFQIQSVVETDTPGEPLDSGRIKDVLKSKLSDEMLKILNTAYTMGYFTVPRENNAEAVADELGIQKSTFSERIRKAQNTLFELVFGARE